MAVGAKGVGRFTRLGIGANLALMCALAIAALVLVNAAARLPGVWLRADLTSHARNELSPQTEKILAALPGEVEVLTFSKPEGRYGGLISEIDLALWRLLKQYRYASNGKIVHESYRLDQDYASARTKLQELEIKEEDNLVVVRALGSKQKPRILRTLGDIASIRWPKRMPTGEEQPPAIDQFRGEEALNGAILSVTQEKKPRIGFLEGHGEPSIADQTSPQGLFSFAEDLRKLGFEPGAVNFSGGAKGLQGLELLVIVGARAALDPNEGAILREYCDGGGRLFILMNPASRPEDDGELGRLLREWGLNPRGGVVREPLGGQMGLPECARLQVLDGLSSFHRITRDLRQAGMRVAFQDSRSFDIGKNIGEGFTLLELASSGLWAWEDQPNGKPLVQDSGLEPSGRRVLAYALEREPIAKEGGGERQRFRAVVVGTISQAINYFQASPALNGAGADFLRNAVSWLIERENLVSISPKPPEQRYFQWNRNKETLFFWFCLFLLPGVCLGAGLLVWFLRRR